MLYLGSKPVRYYNRTTGPRHYTNFQCQGGESNLLDCPLQEANANYFCSSQSDAGIECDGKCFKLNCQFNLLCGSIQRIFFYFMHAAPCIHGSVSLLDYTGAPTNSGSGIVALCMRGIWTAVCDYFWGFRAASVACRGFPGHSPYGRDFCVMKY